MNRFNTFRHWNTRTPIDHPEDIGLAIPSDISVDDVPERLIELYFRFYALGYINNFGTSCVLQSALLRRIMRLHGIDAALKRVVLYWRNDRKGHNMIIGNPHEQLEENQIDTHMVVVSDDWILDFACSPLHYKFGYTAPRGIIVPWTSEMKKGFIDLGIGGKVSYIENTIIHPRLKQVRLSQKPDEMEFTKKYFENYDF